jgi:UDP-N-acetylmuramoylalanine--D-glutamate ligase
VDDSKSTTPEAAVSALAAFREPVLLLAGGYDKGLDPAPLVAAATARAKAVLCYGATGPRLADALRSAGARNVVLSETLAQAMDAAFGLASEGDVLLLSPGHASWDQFRNYEDRAAAFAACLGMHPQPRE